MGFNKLKNYFSGDAVSDTDYAAKDEEDESDKRRTTTSRSTAVVRKAQATTAAPSTSRPENKVVDLNSRRSQTGATNSFAREPVEFMREPAGFTREVPAIEKPRASTAATTAEAYVVFKRLKDFTMASQVADKMVERKIVILNLEDCDDEVARRVLDFIGGVAYACSSMVKRIAGRVFMITPKGVNADGEFFDELRGGNEMNIKYEN